MKKVSMIFSSKLWLLGLGFMAIAISCNKEDELPTIGDPPSEADAQFTYMASAASANVIEFTAANTSLDASWNFGNGSTATGGEVTASYPFEGTYTVTLTVQNSGGSASSTQDIVIAQDDQGLIDNPLFDLLTGGSTQVWIIDSAGEDHFGVGPNPIQGGGNFPEWYSAGPLEKVGGGMYDDRYTFKAQGFGFDMITNGNVYVNSAHAGIAPFDDTTAVIVGDYMAQFPDQLNSTWTLNMGTDTTLTIGGDAFLGYWAGTRTYQVIRLTSEELFLRYVDTQASDPELAWYIRLVPESVGSIPPAPATGYDLPIDFENSDPEFTTFGNSSYAIIDNPDMSGINTSNRVLETVHGNETWAGLFVNLNSALDFSTQSTIKLKVWAPAAGAFRLKLEEQDDPNSFVEIDVNVTTDNAWEEITFDLSASGNTFDRLVIFPGWNVASAGTFYIDDIKQE